MALHSNPNSPSSLKLDALELAAQHSSNDKDDARLLLMVELRLLKVYLVLSPSSVAEIAAAAALFDDGPRHSVSLFRCSPVRAAHLALLRLRDQVFETASQLSLNNGRPKLTKSRKRWDV